MTAELGFSIYEDWTDIWCNPEAMKRLATMDMDPVKMVIGEVLINPDCNKIIDLGIPKQGEQT